MEQIELTKELMAELFHECNKEFFNNELPTIPLRISSGRYVLGSLSVDILSGKAVSLQMSRRYLATRDEFKETMIHEMIHLYQTLVYNKADHGMSFRRVADAIRRMSGGKFNITTITSREKYKVADRYKTQVLSVLY